MSFGCSQSCLKKLSVLAVLSLPAMQGAPTRACPAEPLDMLIGYEEVITCQIGIVGDTDIFHFTGTAGN
jgi:hypothetical protein